MKAEVGRLRKKELDSRLEAVTDCFGSLGIGTDDVGGEANLHAEADVGRIGWGVDDVAADAGSVAIDNRCGEGYRDARCGEGDDRERTNGTFGGNVDLFKIGLETTGASVSTVEISSAASCAFICNEMGIISQDEVIDVGNLLGLRCHG
jgi:hypothetical protein